MADLLEGTPGLKNNEVELKQTIESTVGGTAGSESASDQNLEALPVQVEKVGRQMVAAPAAPIDEAPSERLPSQNFSSALEPGHAEASTVNLQESDAANARFKAAFEDLLNNKELKDAAREFLITARPDTDQQED